jgi:hypothetical protein
VADISPVRFPGDADAGGRDPVAPSVDGAVANAQARFREYESDTFGQGSVIGDTLSLPPTYQDPAVGVQMPGEALPSGSYYDPPRGY